MSETETAQQWALTEAQRLIDEAAKLIEWHGELSVDPDIAEMQRNVREEVARLNRISRHLALLAKPDHAAHPTTRGPTND